MPVKRSARTSKKVKRDSVATEKEVDIVLRPGDTVDEILLPGVHDETTDASDYNDKRRKLLDGTHIRPQKKRRSRRLTLRKTSSTENQPADAISDMEYDTPSETDTRISWSKPTMPLKSLHGKGLDSCTPAPSTAVQHNLSAPTILQIHINATAEDSSPIINLDLSSLMNARNSGVPLTINSNQADLSPVNQAPIPVNWSTVTPPSLRLQRLTEAKRKAPPQKSKIGFTNLPYEIRIRIYRCLFVTRTPITFQLRKDFQRSGSFLRTCKTVHREAPMILYGENSFHFERTHACRGRFFEEDWCEIGFKDVRRFLETIGTKTLPMMRYISFDFTDATRLIYTTDDSDRRFVNDPVVWRCLELIGCHTHLSKFVFTCNGRRNVTRNDLPFLRALASIKAEEVINPTQFCNWGRIKADLVADLLKLMVVARDDPEEVDGKKKKPPTIFMQHECNRGLHRTCTR